MDTSGYDVTEGGDTSSAADTGASSDANNNSDIASTNGHALVLGGHLDVVLDLIVQQSLREQQKRATLRSLPPGHKQQQSQSQQQELPVLTITSSGATVHYVNNDSNVNNSNSSSSGSGLSNSNSSAIDGSGYVDMGAARALSSALITSLCRQGNRSIDT